MNTASDVRCPSCGRLLAKRTADGALEVREGPHHRVVIRDGEISCARCGHTVAASVLGRKKASTWGR